MSSIGWRLFQTNSTGRLEPAGNVSGCKGWPFPGKEQGTDVLAAREVSGGSGPGDPETNMVAFWNTKAKWRSGTSQGPVPISNSRSLPQSFRADTFRYDTALAFLREG